MRYITVAVEFCGNRVASTLGRIENLCCTYFNCIQFKFLMIYSNITHLIALVINAKFSQKNIHLKFIVKPEVKLLQALQKLFTCVWIFLIFLWWALFFIMSPLKYVLVYRKCVMINIYIIKGIADFLHGIGLCDLCSLKHLINLIQAKIQLFTSNRIQKKRLFAIQYQNKNGIFGKSNII